MKNPLGNGLVPGEKLSFRTGVGYDFHRLIPGKKLILGGVEVPFEKGCQAHSDGDVLVHALIDALLGAAALGDIGQHFTDTDPAYKNISSLELLKKTKNILDSTNYTIRNIDSVILLEKPKLQPHIPEMKHSLSACLNLEETRISIKAKTQEQCGIIGHSEGVAALVNVMVNQRNI